VKDNYTSFDIGQRFTIVPATNIPVAKNRIPLIMDRGAFGSGEHETTQSCLEILETLPANKNQKILDLGSGTGILTIASLLLNPGRAWCVDIEPCAINSGKRNSKFNRVDKKITHICGTLNQLQENNFNLILANIYGDILLDVAKELINKAETGALLLLSGILWEYNFDVRKKYQNLGCKLIKNQLMTEFSTVLMQKT